MTTRRFLSNALARALTALLVWLAVMPAGVARAPAARRAVVRAAAMPAPAAPSMMTMQHCCCKPGHCHCRMMMAMMAARLRSDARPAPPAGHSPCAACACAVSPAPIVPGLVNSPRRDVQPARPMTASGLPPRPLIYPRLRRPAPRLRAARIPTPPPRFA